MSIFYMKLSTFEFGSLSTCEIGLTDFFMKLFTF